MSKENQRWMEVALTDLHGKLGARQYEEVDAILADFHIEGHPWIRGVALARGSFAARYKLKSWDAFRDRLFTYLMNQGRDADRLMRGLMGK